MDEKELFEINEEQKKKDNLYDNQITSNINQNNDKKEIEDKKIKKIESKEQVYKLIS